MNIGYFLSSEEWGPNELVALARRASEAGFDRLWISDHFHPWIDEQGHSPFVWSTIGAIATACPGVHVTTAVTCPTVRIHPAVIAHAAATSALLLDGRFTLGVGSGEALNEHILGDKWPEASVRLEMLEEAIEVIRGMWQGGVYSHDGKHYRVEHARIYDLPDEPPPIYISGFGERAIRLAARIGDGFCTVGSDPQPVELFRSAGGGEKPVQGGLKVCIDESEANARKTAHRLWPTDSLPGELSQILPTPSHFEQAATLLTEDAVAEAIPCGPDAERHVKAIEEHAEAGFDELYIQQIGPNQDAFFELYERAILPRLQTALAAH